MSTKVLAHGKTNFYYGLSRLLERAGYLGLRSILILFLYKEFNRFDLPEAAAVYGVMAMAIVFFQFLGGIIGDLALGNRRTMLIGAIMQALGAFCFCTLNLPMLYVGIFLISLGSGFYTPNIIACFGKSYLPKTKLLDAGFSIFYLAVNIGTFIGVGLVFLVQEKYGWTMGFMLAGLLFLSSIIPLLNKENHNEVEEDTKTSSKVNATYVAFAIIIVAIFWSMYELGGFQFNQFRHALKDVIPDSLSGQTFNFLSNYSQLIFLLIASILWSYIYTNQLFKLLLGFIFGTISFTFMFFIPETITVNEQGLFLVGMMFLGLAEALISPIVYSVITQYGNPKYLAILVSLTFIPSAIFTSVFAFFRYGIFQGGLSEFSIPIGVMLSVTIVLLLAYFMNKNPESVESKTYLDYEE